MKTIIENLVKTLFFDCKPYLSYMSSIIYIEFAITFVIFAILFFTLLKRNFASTQCLCLLTIFVFIMYLTILLQYIFVYNFHNLIAYEVGGWRTFNNIRNPESEITLLLDFLETVMSLKFIDAPKHLFSAHRLSFYGDKFIFNMFTYHLKVFCVFLLIICLIIGYLHQKTLKINNHLDIQNKSIIKNYVSSIKIKFLKDVALCTFI